MRVKTMKTVHTDSAGELVLKQSMSRGIISRREILAGLGAVGVPMLLPGVLSAAVDSKKTFTILHTNDIHSNFVGMSPESDYTPLSLNDDKTRGGLARLATLIAARKAARQAQGPVLILDDGDYSNGTAFGAATRETGSELQLLFEMGYDATTFGNHEFDFERLQKASHRSQLINVRFS
jgi:5'-nucleotidase / UDP-sugar diphosphatase